MTDQPFYRLSTIDYQPLVGAHRGASARAPENTLAAFHAALEDGAELIELDVRLTRDGQLAVIHDGDTRRVTGSPGVVAEMAMDDLRRLDAGRHKGAAWAGERIPELGDVFHLVRGRASVNVEVKGEAATVAVLARRVLEYDMIESVIVSSFDRETVRVASSLASRPRTGLLRDEALSDPVDAIRATCAVGASLLHLKYPFVTADVVAALHDAGLGLVAWTVNEPREMRRLAALGVDAILSDDPRLLRETLIPNE